MAVKDMNLTLEQPTLLVTRILQSLESLAGDADLLTQKCGSLVDLVACEANSNGPESATNEALAVVRDVDVGNDVSSSVICQLSAQHSTAP